MHRKFWADVPKDAVGHWNLMFLWLTEEMKLAQAYQIAFWQSALFSYEQGEVVRTEALGDCERALDAHLTENLPFAKGSREYDDFSKDYLRKRKIAAEHARWVLEAAATHGDLVSTNGDATKIDDALIKTVLGGLDASFERLKLLINPVWQGK